MTKKITFDELEKRLKEVKETESLIIEQMLLINREQNGGKKGKRDPKEKIVCEICQGSYTIHNKSSHNKTQKHIKAKESLETLKNIARSKTIARRVAPPTLKTTKSTKKPLINKDTFKTKAGSKTTKKPTKTTKKPKKSTKTLTRSGPKKTQTGGDKEEKIEQIIDLNDDIVEVDDKINIDNNNDILDNNEKENIRNIIGYINGNIEGQSNQYQNETEIGSFGGIFTEQDEERRRWRNRLF